MSDWNALLEVDPEKRDEAWEKKFLEGLSDAKVSILNAEPQVGPDHWPYLFVGTGPMADEPLVQVLSWLSTRGIGLAVNPQKDSPDFVLTYGMIWNYRERGVFLSEAPASSGGSFRIEPGQEVLTGPPSEAFLPSYVRAILKQFLADQGVFSPKILMASFDKMNFELCFSIESLNSPKAEEHQGIAEALSWFLPAHYPVALISEKTIPGFQPL